jgi:hypothetical protein
MLAASDVLVRLVCPNLYQAFCWTLQITEADSQLISGLQSQRITQILITELTNDDN